MVVQPATVRRWRRTPWWRHLGQRRGLGGRAANRPKAAGADPTYGGREPSVAQHAHRVGRLPALGFRVSNSTVRRYRGPARDHCRCRVGQHSSTITLLTFGKPSARSWAITLVASSRQYVGPALKAQGPLARRHASGLRRCPVNISKWSRSDGASGRVAAPPASWLPNRPGTHRISGEMRPDRFGWSIGAPESCERLDAGRLFGGPILPPHNPPRPPAPPSLDELARAL